MSRRWYTSDLHLGHKKVSELRGRSVGAWVACVCDMWSTTIRPDDQVYLLGDMISRSQDSELMLSLVSSLPGRKHLIAGNHDPVGLHSQNGQAKWLRPYLDVFETVRQYSILKFDGGQVALSHYPYRGDRGPDRYRQFRLRDMGLPLLHGHTHSSARWDLAEPRQIHVGIDAWGRFVSDDDLLPYIRRARRLGAATRLEIRS